MSEKIRFYLVLNEQKTLFICLLLGAYSYINWEAGSIGLFFLQIGIFVLISMLCGLGVYLFKKANHVGIYKHKEFRK